MFFHDLHDQVKRLLLLEAEARTAGKAVTVTTGEGHLKIIPQPHSERLLPHRRYRLLVIVGSL